MTNAALKPLTPEAAKPAPATGGFAPLRHREFRTL